MKHKLSINWEITRKCNLQCAYCRVNGGIEQKEELSTKQVFFVIDQLIKNGYGHFKFTGGEPLIRKDFWEIVKYAHKNNCFVSLISNGLLINDSNIKLFKKYISIIGISLDSTNKKTNEILGRRNFNLVMENIKKLSDCRLHVKILSTITNINKDQIPNLIKTTRELNAEELKINDIVINGRAKQSQTQLGLTRPLLDSSKELITDVEKILKSKVIFNKFFKCECSNNNLFIDYKGDLYPCVEMCYLPDDYCLGNIKNNKLENLLKINKKFYNQIINTDVCAYSYMCTTGFSACLNRGKCPKNLKVYFDNAQKA